MTSVVFMGTPQFAAPILESLVEEGYDVKAVLTQPDRPVGRKRILTPSPVKEVALKHDLPVLQPQKLSGSPEMAEIIAMEPDLLITAAYGQFLPTKLLNAAQIGAINVHGSLLPKYRGGAPIQYAIKNGDDKTGVTIMYMVKEMDAGDMISKVEVPITATDDAGSMFEKLSIAGRDLLLETLPDLIAGNITPVAQNPAEVTFSPTIKPKEEALSLDQTAQEIDWQTRAFRPAPGAFFNDFNGKRTKIWSVTPLTETTDLPSGSVVEVNKKVLKMAAAEGTVYQINELQPAGKPKMPVAAYLNGVGQNLKTGEMIINGEQKD